METPAESSDENLTEPAPASVSEPVDWSLRSALLIALVWYTGLLLLARSATDSVMLNVRQIHQADAIVTAQVKINAKQVPLVEEVTHTWFGADDEAAMAFSLPESICEDGEYIVPLSKTSDGWRVTLAPVGGGTPLVYPATEEAKIQLQRMLDAGGR